MRHMGHTFGERVRLAREAKDWTQEDAASRIGRPLSWLSRIESGRTKNLPEPDEFRRLVAVLGMSTAEALISIGYLSPSDVESDRANPFDRDDPRWQLVEKLKRIQLDQPGAAFVTKAVSELIDLAVNDPSLFGNLHPPSRYVALDDTTQVGNHDSE